MSAGAKLTRALEAMARAAGCDARVAAAGERPWASATFVGATHAFAIDAAPCPALAAWLAALPEAEFAVPGHVVADVAVAHDGDAVRVTALVLDEA